MAGAAAAGMLMAASPCAVHSQEAGRFNEPGNIVIADQFNNRVVEIDRKTHAVVWQFGTGADVPGPTTIVGTNDAERFGSYTLISGTGIPGVPPGTPPLPGCAHPLHGNPALGCPDNRVIIVDRDGRILWKYGSTRAGGSGYDQLNTPVQAVFLSSFPGHWGFHVMITDQANQRVIVVNREREIVWQYGTTGVAGSGPDQLNNPNSAELLENGHILIADENNNRVIEVRRDKTIDKVFTAQGTVSGAAFASRLENGDTLITDSNNNRAVEVDAGDAVVWQYLTNTQPGSNPNPQPSRAIRLRNGNTLISDQFNERVIEVDPYGSIVFQQGRLDAAGSGYDRLDGPYDAKAVGDYTGLTPPFAVEF